MKDFERANSAIIDLGQASIETRGNALFEIDVSSGRLSYATGTAEE